MPVTRTATRALRKSKNKEKRNRIIKAKIKNTLRKGKKTDSDEKTEVKKLLSQTYKILDKAAKEHILHANKAARLKSRLTKKINLLAVTTEKKEVKKTRTKKKKA